VLLIRPPSEAAVPVTEVGAQLVAAQNISVQSTITAIEAVLQTGYMVLELTQLGELALDSHEWEENVNAIAVVLNRGVELAWEQEQVDALLGDLFSIDTVPETATALAERAREHREAIVAYHGFALRTQTLITTGWNTVAHLLALFAPVGDFVGNMQANQALQQAHLKLGQLAAEQKTLVAAFDRAKSVEALTAPQLSEALIQINRRMMEDHPRP
jgi:hypothetical protein